MGSGSAPRQTAEEYLDIPAFLRPKPISTTATNARREAVLVVGIGGAGHNYIRHLVQQSIAHVDCVVVDSDNHYSDGVAARYLLTSDPSTSRWSAFNTLINQYRVVVVHVGLGGYSGSMLAPMVVQSTQRAGAFPVVHCSLPASREGRQRLRKAHNTLNKLSSMGGYILQHDNGMLERYGEIDGQSPFEPVHRLFDEEVRLLTPFVQASGKRATYEQIKLQREKTVAT